MIEEIQAIGEVIAGLGEAGKGAFMWWLVTDLIKTGLVYGLSWGAVAFTAHRIGNAITAAMKVEE